MTNPSSPALVPSAATRRVLLWRPEPDESQVQANVEQAAQFLSVRPEEVVAAIDRGDLVGGWFVDWAADGTA